MTNIIKGEAMALETIMNHIDGFDHIPAEKYDEHNENIKSIKKISNDERKESKIIDDIAKRMDKLEDDISKMEDSSNSLKVYVEQRKAIHEIKKILHDAGKYDKYNEEELDEIEKLFLK